MICNYGKVSGTPSQDYHAREREVDIGRDHVVSPSSSMQGRWIENQNGKKVRLRGIHMQQDKVGCVAKGGENRGLEDIE